MTKTTFTAVLISILFILPGSERVSMADMACDDYQFTYRVREQGAIDDPPGATSTLLDKKNPGRYSVGMAFDGKIETAWVEGKRGDGIGEYVAFYINKMKALSILPGFGMTQYFKKNNRLKEAVFELYLITNIHAAQCAATYVVRSKPVFSKVLKFKDAMAMQTFRIPFRDISTRHKSDKGYIGVIVIKKVYPGSKWRDTCIAEIKVN